ncbi:hypothetical protein ACQJBY_037769 [Aegilops geniculata]
MRTRCMFLLVLAVTLVVLSTDVAVKVTAGNCRPIINKGDCNLDVCKSRCNEWNGHSVSHVASCVPDGCQCYVCF